MQTYKLDPCWYFTTPALSWDAMLLHTKVAIELFTDYDMLLFIEKGVRGGINQCCNRYAIANNRYMSNFNPDDEIKYLMYLDANNLYGYAMSKYLPLKDFVWSDNDLTEQGILNLSDESDVGYILEVDLEYPSDLHDKHSDFPLAPENKPPPNCKEPRLLTTLEPKTKYVLHYSNLKLYLKLVLVLKKIHRVLKFFQSPWLKNYIDYNTKLRTKSVNDFQKDYYKLMNNSIFGKTMENVRRRVDIRLCSTEEQARKLIAKSNFNRRTIFSENLMAVHPKKSQIKFFKPIQVGMVILDISKVLMYSFHYEYMKHRYDSKVRLMYTNTDSFIYEIKTDDFYSDMKEDINLYDTSDYDENNIYNLPLVNKKVIGKMKDENKGNIMTEYVGLKSKMRKTTQLVSRNETTQLGSRNETTQLASRNETQLVSRNETTHLCTAVDRLQPPAPPLQQNRLFLPTHEGQKKFMRATLSIKENALRASYLVANRIAKAKKPFTVGEE
ncbi:uncharacterized protein TNCV_1394741 [Trichonephila clavipes]|nr:uncharacterized protein TNCV_1394741 [Trichonephila clavipes]